MTSWWQRLTGRATATRTRGRPTSANGASSFHLWWRHPDVGPIAAVDATLEIVEPPQVAALYFWAMQVTFAGGGPGEGAHLGLQHHPRFPGMRAVNWGGYASGGGLLDGAPSPLPSTPGDPNTRDFPWQAGVPYRLRIRRVEADRPTWRGEVEAPDGTVTVVRDLYTEGDRLAAPVVWTEAFADCDAPSVAARWSDLTVVGADGRRGVTREVQVNYQAVSAGGCSNTDVAVDADGWTQRTNTERRTHSGAILRLPAG